MRVCMGGVKVDLLNYIKSENPPDVSDSNLRGTIFQDSVLAITLNLVMQWYANYFKEYPENAFFPTIKSKSKRADMISIVLHTHKPYQRDGSNSTT